MNKRMIDDVRQVLMNELGLTREVVREETERIVRETVEKHLHHMLQQNQFENIIIEKVGNLLAEQKESWPRTGKARIEGIISEAAQTAARQFIAKHISFQANP